MTQWMSKPRHRYNFTGLQVNKSRNYDMALLLYSAIMLRFMKMQRLEGGTFLASGGVGG